MLDSLFQYINLPVTLFGIIALEALGLQLIVGGAGMLSLGHAAFFAIGGYSAACFSVLFAPHLGMTNGYLILASSLFFSVLISSLCASLFVIPCLRLRGDYFAIATLGFSQIVENILYNTQALGGASGFTGISHLSNVGLVWFFVFLVLLFLYRFYKTPLGYSILCTREDELVATCLGISPARSKFFAFVIGCAITGLAGCFYAHTFQFMSPSSAGFGKSVEILLAVVVGGLFSIWGSLLGAGVIVLLPELLRFLPESAALYHMLIFSLIVIFVIRTNNQGLVSLWKRI
jgi:branched-chain amino acid transport system permease protein